MYSSIWKVEMFKFKGATILIGSIHFSKKKQTLARNHSLVLVWDVIRCVCVAAVIWNNCLLIFIISVFLIYEFLRHFEYLPPSQGTDAIQTARLGMSDPKFDVSAWTEYIGNIITVCPAREQGQIKFAKRNGEMHCIEPMQNNVALVNNASASLGLNSEEFVVTQAAISGRVSVERDLLIFTDRSAYFSTCYISHILLVISFI